jgi:pimeloyl-ACP methyl ester carboxylesterase
VNGHRVGPWAAALLVIIGALSVFLGADAPAIADRRVQVGGREIRYLESGAGPAVVLVHGFGADVRAWRFVIPALSPEFHVFALDQLGFGQSEKPEIPYRVGTLADTLAGFISTLGLSKPSIVGHSLGGWVAAMYAVSHPDRLAKLVLVDAAGYGEDPAQLVRDYVAQYDPAAAAAAERVLSRMTPEDRRQTEALMTAMIARRLARGDGYAVASLGESILRGEDALGPEMKTIRTPTLVIWGREDPIIPLRVADALARDVPGARKLVLDGCGHRPPTECASPFNAALRQFLRD